MQRSNERLRPLAATVAGTTFQCIPGWHSMYAGFCIPDEPVAAMIALVVWVFLAALLIPRVFKAFVG